MSVPVVSVFAVACSVAATPVTTAVLSLFRLLTVASNDAPPLSSAIFLRLSARVAPPVSMLAGVPILVLTAAISSLSTSSVSLSAPVRAT